MDNFYKNGRKVESITNYELRITSDKLRVTGGLSGFYRKGAENHRVSQRDTEKTQRYTEAALNVIAGATRNPLRMMAQTMILAIFFAAAGVYAQPCTPITTVGIGSSDAVASTIIKKMDYYGAWKTPADASATFTATASGGSAATVYEWYVNGALQIGATGATFVFNLPAGVEGEYSVYAAAVNGCTGSNTARSGEMVVFVTKGVHYFTVSPTNYVFKHDQIGSGVKKPIDVETNCKTGWMVTAITNGSWLDGVPALNAPQTSPFTFEVYPNSLNSGTAERVAVITVTACGVNKTIDVVQLPEFPIAPPGDFCLSGSICFDVAQTEGGESCGYLQVRNSDFSQPARIYTLNGDASEIKFYVIDDAKGVVANLATSGNTVEVTFVSNIDAEMTGEKATFSLLAQFKDNVSQTYMQQMLKVKVQDCTCGCIVKSGTCSWKAFMCYNLGANPSMSIVQQMAYVPNISDISNGTSVDATVFGDLYQWGRKKDGHEKRTSMTAAGPMSGSNLNPVDGQVTGANVGRFITNTNGAPNGWRSPEDTKLWDKNENAGSSTNPLKYEGNDPCPDGWRVPTGNEFDALVSTTLNTHEMQTTNTRGYLIRPNDPGATEWTLFLPAAGSRLYQINMNGFANQIGEYWSSSSNGSTLPNTTYGRFLTFNCLGSGTFATNNTYRGVGMSIRCIADE